MGYTQRHRRRLCRDAFPMCKGILVGGRVRVARLDLFGLGFFSAAIDPALDSAMSIMIAIILFEHRDYFSIGEFLLRL